MDLVEVIVIRIIAPFVIGYGLFWMIHWTMGLIANIEAVDDEIRLSKWKYYYMIGIIKSKELLWPWALGVIVFMLIGII